MHCVYCGRPLQLPQPRSAYPAYMRQPASFPGPGKGFYQEHERERHEGYDFDEQSAYWFKQEPSQYARQFDHWAQ